MPAPPASPLVAVDANVLMDFERLTIELQKYDLTAPVIATPREIVRKFFLR